MGRINAVKAIMGVVCAAIALGILVLADYTAMTAIVAIALIITGIAMTWLIRPAIKSKDDSDD